MAVPAAPGTEPAMALLGKYRCDMAQGFLFRTPLGPGEMLAWCRNDLRMAEAEDRDRAPAG